MKHDIRRMALAAVIPLFLLFILYILKFWRQAWIGTSHDWEYIRLNSGRVRIFAHPLVHSSFSICSPIRFHSFPDVVSVLFLPAYSPYIFFAIWIGCGALTFLIGKPGWHIGASGIIYGLAFSVLQRHSAQTCTAYRHFTVDNVPIWRPGMEYVPTICQSHHFLRRTP